MFVIYSLPALPVVKSKRLQRKFTGCVLPVRGEHLLTDGRTQLWEVTSGDLHYLQSHEAGTRCHVIRLLGRDLASLNNLDLSCWRKGRQELLVYE